MSGLGGSVVSGTVDGRFGNLENLGRVVVVYEKRCQLLFKKNIFC